MSKTIGLYFTLFVGLVFVSVVSAEYTPPPPPPSDPDLTVRFKSFAYIPIEDMIDPLVDIYIDPHPRLGTLRNFAGYGHMSIIYDSYGTPRPTHFTIGKVQDRIAVVYRREESDELRYLIESGSTFYHFSSFSEFIDSGYEPDLAELNGIPTVSYYSGFETQDLMLAQRIDDVWQTSLVTPDGNSGRHSSVALVDGKVTIAYRWGNHLRLAIQNEDSWDIQAVLTPSNCQYDPPEESCLRPILAHGEISLLQHDGQTAILYLGNGGVWIAQPENNYWTTENLGSYDSDIGDGELRLVPATFGTDTDQIVAMWNGYNPDNGLNNKFYQSVLRTDGNWYTHSDRWQIAPFTPSFFDPDYVNILAYNLLEEFNEFEPGFDYAVDVGYRYESGYVCGEDEFSYYRRDGRYLGTYTIEVTGCTNIFIPTISH